MKLQYKYELSAIPCKRSFTELLHNYLTYIQLSRLFVRR